MEDLKKYNIINLFDFLPKRESRLDDYPFGGGEGMIMKMEPILKAYESLDSKKSRVIFPTPDGKMFNQNIANELSKEKKLVFICGHYKGIDQRVIDKYVDEEISIGDFILSGGEYAAVCLIDAITRHIPGTLGNEDSYLKDTFSNGLLKGDVYAKPESFESMKVPDVLLSGNHKEIDSWREHNSLLKTFIKRPELLNDVKLTKKQKKLLEEWASKDIL